MRAPLSHLRNLSSFNGKIHFLALSTMPSICSLFWVKVSNSSSNSSRPCMYCSCAPHPREDNHSILVRGIDVSIWFHSVLPLLHGQRPSFSLCSHLYQSW